MEKKSINPLAMTEYILASKSPRRQMLLRNLFNHFIVLDTDVEETKFPGEKPAAYVLRLAEGKALAAGKRMVENSLPEVVVIAADTIVVDQDEMLGKPKDPEDARIILDRLKGKTHQVLSGLAVYHLPTREMRSRVITTEVTMRHYSEKEILDYIASGDPFDKAGAYAIQNESFNPAPEFNGCFANVMGLPLCHLSLLIQEVEGNLNSRIADRCQESINYQCPVYPRILSGEHIQ
jgi:MAF protein